MTHRDADVIVVGGGPAGAVSALLLARAGVDVLVVDRATFPRPKPCGDCMSAEATRLLERLGLLQSVEAAPHARLEGWRIFAPAGHHFEARFSDVAFDSTAGSGAIAMERRILDHILLRAAAQAGARIRENTRVHDVDVQDDIIRGVVITEPSNGGGNSTLRARHVIGADGLRSIVSRRLGAVARKQRARKLSLTVHIDGPMPFDCFGEMHMGDGICIGVAPVRQDHQRWNVTLVADAGRFGRSVAADAQTFFQTAVDSIPGTRGRIDRHALASALNDVLASGPFDVPTRRIAWPGATLVGDAAGYFDPFTGQGVYHGMRTAEILAGSLIPLLAGSGAHVPVARDYARSARRLTRGPRRLQKVIDTVLGRPASANRAIRRLANAPAAAQALVDVTGDVVPVRSLFSPAVGRSLLFPRRTATPR